MQHRNQYIVKRAIQMQDNAVLGNEDEWSSALVFPGKQTNPGSGPLRQTFSHTVL